MLTMSQKRGGAFERETSEFVSVEAVVRPYVGLSSLCCQRPSEAGGVT